MKLYNLVFAVILITISSCEFQKGSEGETGEHDHTISNSIHMISPYKWQGVWVFDDPRVNLKKEPFVEGIPEIIDSLVWDIPDAENGFTLYFSDQAMPGYELSLTWIREQYYGNWYVADGFGLEGWLCPSLFEYYDTAPEKLYIKAEPK